MIWIYIKTISILMLITENELEWETLFFWLPLFPNIYSSPHYTLCKELILSRSWFTSCNMTWFIWSDDCSSFGWVHRTLMRNINVLTVATKRGALWQHWGCSHYRRWQPHIVTNITLPAVLCQCQHLYQRRLIQRPHLNLHL